MDDGLGFYIGIYFVFFIPFFIFSEFMISATGSKVSRKKVYGIFTIVYVCIITAGIINDKINERNYRDYDKQERKNREEVRDKMAFFRPCNNNAYCVKACKTMQLDCQFKDCKKLDCSTRAVCGMDGHCNITREETSKRK